MSNAERFDDRVRALRDEAAIAGDLRMVAICDRALDCRDDYGTEEAREECALLLALDQLRQAGGGRHGLRIRDGQGAAVNREPFEVRVYSEGAQAPHWKAGCRTLDEAERIAARYRDRADRNGWNVRVEVSEVQP